MSGPTLGCRVKSGRAIAVVVDGPPAAPRAIGRRELVLCDPKTPATKQPYHAAMGQAQTDQREIDRLTAIVARCADRAVDQLLASSAVGSACLVVGSVVEPATLTSQHMRAHAYEGQLFRTALERALESRGVACRVIVDKRLDIEADAAGLMPAARARTLEAFGKALGRPWTADEKAAALGAWIVMA